MFKKILTYILILCLTFVPSATAQPSLQDAQVTWRNDADTFKVKLPVGIVTEVRLACIDAPEIPHTKTSKQTSNASLLKHFQWGERSSGRVEKLMPIKSNIKMLPVSVDYKYGRTVAEVILSDGTNLGQLLLSEGLAQIYDEYVNLCPDKDNLIAVQNQAKVNKIGIWSDDNYIPPAIARKLSRIVSVAATESVPVVVAVDTKVEDQSLPVATVSALPECVKTDCNCKDFLFQQDAQQVLDAFPNDPFLLDADQDGVACERLKRRR